MPELGGLPRRSRSHDASAPTRLSGAGRSPRDQVTPQRQPPLEHWMGQAQPSGMADLPLNSIGSDNTRRQRLTLWQALFGQGQRRTNRRSALQQAKRKEVKASSHNLPFNLFQRLNRQERSHTNDQTASRIAEDKVRRAVLGRSQQMHGALPGASKHTQKSREKLPKTRQDNTHRSSQAIPSFQSLPLSTSPQTNGRDQARLGLRREVRAQTRRSASTGRNHGAGLSEHTQADRKTRSSTTPLKQENKPRSRSFSAGIYAARMLILSVGIGVLVGTMLSMLDPAARSSAGASQQAAKTDAADSPKAQATAISQVASPVEGASATQLPKMGQELTSLKAALQTLTLQTPQLTPGIFLFDLDTDAYLDLNGGASFAAASTIKVPILIAFFQDVDAGKIRLDELLTIQKELVAGGSGEMQGLPMGTQFTALETVTKMITISDNTATNMVIARLGGMAALDQRFRSWGLVSTAINSVLPDLNGTNTTSPKDMALLMTRISQGELVSMRSRDRLLDIMQRTVNRSQLPQGLGKGATIAHKTGDIGSMIGDVGLIDMPNGKRYALTVLVKRSFNDGEAYDLVQKASRTVYQFLSRVPAPQNDSATNSAAPARQGSPRANSDVPTPSSPTVPADTTITQSPSVDTATR